MTTDRDRVEAATLAILDEFPVMMNQTLAREIVRAALAAADALAPAPDREPLIKAVLRWHYCLADGRQTVGECVDSGACGCTAGLALAAADAIAPPPVPLDREAVARAIIDVIPSTERDRAREAADAILALLPAAPPPAPEDTVTVAISDPIERIIAVALTAAGVRFSYEALRPSGRRLDFVLDNGVAIEVKQFASERTRAQLASEPNVILIQGRQAAEWFASVLPAARAALEATEDETALANTDAAYERNRANAAEACLARAWEALLFCKRAVGDPRLGWPEETRGAVVEIADRALADGEPANTGGDDA